jgi:hypothetical protein
MTTRLTNAQRVQDQQREREFQRQVMDYARLNGWEVRHIHDSRREVVDRKRGRLLVGDADAAGLPDLIMVRPPVVLFAELKRRRGKASDAQVFFLGLLAGCGPNVRVKLWRPGDWSDIETTLRR